MADESPDTTDSDEAERAAQALALRAELDTLAGKDDPAILERRYDLHRALVWQVWAVGTTRGQEQAEQAVAIARQLQDRRREAAALHDLASAYLYEHGDATGDGIHPTQEESQAGQRLHEEALRINEATLGPEHPDVAESLLRIVGQGSLWWPIDPYVAMAERAAQILERAFGLEHERTCAALERLAQMLQFSQRHDRALAIYQRLLEIYTRIYGPDDRYHTRNAVAAITGLHRALGDYASAEALMRGQLRTLRDTAGDYDWSVLAKVVEISDLLWQQGDYAAADAEIAQVLARLEAELGPEHPTTLAFLARLGSSHQAHSELPRARQVYERLLAVHERDAPQSVTVYQTKTLLLTILWQLGETSAASALFDALLLHTEQLPELGRLLDTLNMLSDIASDAASEDRGSVLLMLFERWLAAYEQQFGPDHPDIVPVLIGWSQRLVHDRAGELPATVAPLYRALAISPQALADPDEKALRVIRTLDDLLSEAEDDAAAALYRRVLDICTPALGASHPRIIDLGRRLERLTGEPPAFYLSHGGRTIEPLEDATVVIFQSPSDRIAAEALRAHLTGNSDLVVAVAPTLDAALATSADVLILVLPDDRPIELTVEQIVRLQNQKVIGIGYGAAMVFGQLGLEINAGACAHFGAMSMVMSVESNELVQLPGQDSPAGVTHSDGLEEVDHVGVHIPTTSHLVQVVDVIARAHTSYNYALIARQGHHVLIGLAAPADAWTPAYAEVFREITRAVRASPARPFTRAVWPIVAPGSYPLTLAESKSTTEATSYHGHLRFDTPTTFQATLRVTGSANTMLLFMGERREHWTREDGADGETLSITIEITEADLSAVGDRYWIVMVANFDDEHAAMCELTIVY